jgi:hypothetical protein
MSEELVESTGVVEASEKKSKKSIESKKVESNGYDRKKEIAKDTRIVKGIFKNNELPGAPLKFSFLKYKEVPLESYYFEDGKVYEVPYMIAHHLNNNCSYPIYQHVEEGDGKFRQKIGRKVQRFSFVPLDFIDESSLGRDIITVQNI